MKKILAFGYIPKQLGGKQTTGLATGIFDLHDAVNALNSDYKILIAATDINEEEKRINNTSVIGWNRKILIRHVLKYPFRFLYFAYRVFYLYFKFRKLISFPTILAKAVFLDYAIEKTKPDLIHFHGTSGAWLSFCLWNKKQNCILRIHGINGFDPSIPNFKIHRKIEKFITDFKFVAVTFVAKNILKEWKREYGSFNCEMVSVLNGYNPKLFYPVKENFINKKYDIITISGLSERKGQIRVLKALIKLQQEEFNLSYLIIGSGTIEEKEKINKLINSNKLKVKLIDYLPQEELNVYLHQSKYFILPSITEGFGKVYVESIGSGTPVIIPGHLPLAREVGVLNSLNSFQLKDSTTDSIFIGLKKLFKHPIKHNPIEVSKTVNHLHWSYIAKQYIALYQLIFNKQQ